MLLKICFAKTCILESSFQNSELDMELSAKAEESLSKKIIIINSGLKMG